MLTMPFITICDDSLQDLMYMEKMLYHYRERNPDSLFAVNKYSDPGKLYARIEEGEYADIYILDILMPDKSGIELGYFCLLYTSSDATRINKIKQHLPEIEKYRVKK